MSIEGSYGLMYNGEKVGEVRAEANGIRWHISAHTDEFDDDRPFRLGAVCGGKTVPLGIMMPKNGGFSFDRLFSSSSLKSLGFEDPSEFVIITESGTRHGSGSAEYAVPESERWTETKSPGEYIAQGEFRDVFSACPRAFVGGRDDITYIAVPIEKDVPFPAMQVFCLGEVQKVNSQMCMVFKIRNGKLIF